MPRWTVAPDEDGTRLDHFVARRAGLSHAAARRVVEDHVVRVEGHRGRKGAVLRAGETVDLDDETALLPPRESAPVPESDAPLTILFLDEHVVVLDKPAGVPTHPLRPGETGTLANALAARHPECSAAGDDAREGGFAHRLDTGTSGVIVAARTREAWSALRSSFTLGEAQKTYLALVFGDPPQSGSIDHPIAHDPANPARALVIADPIDAMDKAARSARTSWTVLARATGEHPGRMALVRATAETGRLHQIRAHMAAAGYPLFGDPLYGGPAALPDTNGPFLHAERLVIPHPHAGTIDVSAPLPVDRRAALERVGIPILS